MSDRVPDGGQMVRDLQSCNRMVDGILKELDRAREPLVLWKVQDVDDGEATNWFIAPKGWSPAGGGVLERFQYAHDVRIVPVGEIPRLGTDDEVLKHLKRGK